MICPSNLPADRRRWSADALDAWQERAAIMEFDAHMPRLDAERAAEADVRRQYEPERLWR